MNRIKYSNGNTGSSIVDLVMYMITPTNFSKRARPIDYPAFLDLARSLGLPETVLGSEKTFNDYSEAKQVAEATEANSSPSKAKRRIPSPIAEPEPYVIKWKKLYG